MHKTHFQDSFNPTRDEMDPLLLELLTASAVEMGDALMTELKQNDTIMDEEQFDEICVSKIPGTVFKTNRNIIHSYMLS